MKVLISGWFSFELMGASAGDLLATDVVCKWLSDSGWTYDIAVAPPFTEGVDWTLVDPRNYKAVIFICGPFGNGWPLTEFLPKFQNLPLIGLNLTMLDSLQEWNPFDLLLERDSNEARRPDLVFLSDKPTAPVVGLILVEVQKEYGNRACHTDVEKAVRMLIANNEMAVIPIDTRLDKNKVGLRTSAEIESLIRKMDMVITTRLHGMVLALKNGIPALVIDPISGGAKIKNQAETIGWKTLFGTDNLDQSKLQTAVDFCLSEQGRSAACDVKSAMISKLTTVKDEFLQGLQKSVQ